MPSRPSLNQAVPQLKRELETEQPTIADLTARQAWIGFLRFGRRRFAAAGTPDADGLLFQYGTHSFGDPPTFVLDFTRQFDINDADGDHHHYVQVHCELKYAPEPALRELGSFNSWYFHDSDDNIEQWSQSLSDLPIWEPLHERTPAEINIHAELV